MLKASNLNAVHNVSLFLGALVDALCGLSRTAEVTSAMNEYVEMINLVFRRHMSFEWTEKTIHLLERCIRLFNKRKDLRF